MNTEDGHDQLHPPRVPLSEGAVSTGVRRGDEDEEDPLSVTLGHPTEIYSIEFNGNL